MELQSWNLAIFQTGGSVPGSGGRMEGKLTPRVSRISGNKFRSCFEAPLQLALQPAKNDIETQTCLDGLQFVELLIRNLLLLNRLSSSNSSSLDLLASSSLGSLVSSSST